MAGLAAALNAPIEAMADALGARGADGARCRLAGAHGGRLEVCVRAALPSVARVLADQSNEVVAAFAVDGVASVTALDRGYAARGPGGLLVGEDPYAVVVADAEREVLVLARNGDGPGLYYARHGEGWLVASEPAALLTAGVAARADQETVRRFIVDGSCDDTPHTFFAGITQVRAGEPVVLARIGAIRLPRVGPDVVPALEITADADGRPGVLLGPGMGGAAVLGAVLSRGDAPKPVAVHTVAFSSVAAVSSLPSGVAAQPAVLQPLPHALVRHHPHQLDAAQLDLDAFLRDAGEPLPDLGLFCAWAVARDIDGGVDTLLDSSRGGPAGVARLSDRLRARYGVALRCPLRAADVDGLIGDAQLMSVASRGLLPPVVRFAAQDRAEPVELAQVVLAMREPVAAALGTDRPWVDQASALAQLRRLAAGEPVDAGVLWRTYLVERWLRLFGVDTGGAAPRPRPPELAPAPLAASEVVVAGRVWTRIPVRTQRFAPGDAVVVDAAWYAASRLADLAGEHRDALTGPWFAVLSAKPLAVGQRRATPLWEIAPGGPARMLSRVARGSLGQAWTMQVALQEGGMLRVGVSTLADAVGLRDLARRLLPVTVARLTPPRADAMTPADTSVVRPPFHADEACAALCDALRYSLPPELANTLAGCAVVAAGGDGARVLGYASGPNAAALPEAMNLLPELCVGNPAGQTDERTPLVLIMPAPVPRVRPRGQRDPSRIDIKGDRASAAVPRPSPPP